MLKVPAFEYYSDLRVTAYQDDTMFWKFYIVPDYVSIRRDINGNPVFLLIKYAFSDQDRRENPELGRGGGYLSFDVDMAVPEADREQILERLQKQVDDEWNRLKVLAESAGQNVRGAAIRSWYHHDGALRQSSLSVDDVRLGLHPDRPEAPPGDKPPLVQLSVPTWTDGTFQISAPQSDALVSNRVTEGPVSLVGSNTAAANMDLTPAGATFMHKTLVDNQGAGATDLTPIQVLYQLKFWARIPPVKLSISADTRDLHMALQSIEHDYDGHSCEEDDMYHYEQYMDMAVSSSLIKVSFDTGTLSLDEEFIQELRESAMKIVMDRIKETFYDKGDTPAADDAPPDFTDSTKDIRYLKTTIDYKSVSINYDETMTSIVEWKANPQGTMQGFFAGLSASEMSKYVRVVDLDDDFFKTLGLAVNVFADWENEPIAFVECQLRYTGRDENNTNAEKVETFTLTKDNHRGEWDPSLIGAKREYEFRWRVGFQGREPGDFTRWERDTTPNLNLSIADPGKISVRVLAGNLNFAQTIDKVQVEMSYSDTASGVGEEAYTMVLADGQQEQVYERYIYSEWDRPVKYRSRFFLTDGQQIEGEWQETMQRQLLVNAPLFDSLDVRLVPAGDWDGVVQSVVSLRYVDDANNYHSDQAFSLKNITEFKTWSVVLRDPNNRKFQYKVLTSFQDGTVDETDWTDGDGDQALPILVKQVPRLKVQLLPAMLEFAITPVVMCTLRYEDPDGDVQEVESFTFTEGKPAEWNVIIADEERNKYSYELTYHTADGRTVEVPATSADATSLVIPRLDVPEIVCNLVPKLVKFTETPVVEIAIEYQDSEHDIDFADTLVFTEMAEQTVRIPVHEDSPPDYSLTVTYYLDNGEVVERETVTLHKKRVVIPRYIATA